MLHLYRSSQRGLAPIPPPKSEWKNCTTVLAAATGTNIYVKVLCLVIVNVNVTLKSLNICRRLSGVFSSSKYTKTRFRLGLCPGPRWESLRVTTLHHRPLISAGERDIGDNLPLPFPLGPRRLWRLVLSSAPRLSTCLAPNTNSWPICLCPLVLSTTDHRYPRNITQASI